jgi:hypothetical protein
VIDAALLLKDLQGELGRLAADLLAHLQEDSEVRARLEGEWRKAFDAQRTGRTLEDWLDDRLTQVAVAWLLAFVFVRFCEDNGLIDEARIAGVGTRGGEARDAQQRFFAQHPHASDRDYLHEVFRSAAQLRGLDGVVGEEESPLWLVDPPADAITRVMALFRSTDEGGALVHDFRDPELSTRFLGNLYQDLSDHAKSTYALLQTPEFVEEFILDRTLDPAIETFGLANTTMIDPTCGSGHFLLGGFHRIFEAWRVAEPGVSAREHAERALKAVTGVDLNPFAAAIARFRLLVASLVASGERRLADAPMLEPDVAVGDSLLWGARSGQFTGMELSLAPVDRQFLYATEDADQLRAIFDRRFAAVVGNPPYIEGNDPVLRAAYRARYRSCSGRFHLSVPFTERFAELADAALDARRGFIGLITDNAFMTRTYGRRFVEEWLPSLDLTDVIDTSQAIIPGHATATVIMFARSGSPSGRPVRLVAGIRSDDSVPADASQGAVWKELVSLSEFNDLVGTFASVQGVERSRFNQHPWSIGGGGAAELKESMVQGSVATLTDFCEVIGVGGMTNADQVMIEPSAQSVRRQRVESWAHRPLVIGENVRDWRILRCPEVLFPYQDGALVEIDMAPGLSARLWGFRTILGNRATFTHQTYFDEGRPWWAWHQISLERLDAKRAATFAEVATHNHFAELRPGLVANKTAPLIIFKDEVSDVAFRGVLGALNSSSICFWMKQVFHDKGAGGLSGGLASEAWERRYALNSTNLGTAPLPIRRAGAGSDDGTEAGQRLANLASALLSGAGSAVLDSAASDGDLAAQESVARGVALQEELDWECLHLYGITDHPVTVPAGLDAPALQLGERAFEIVMARQMNAGALTTAWFERHGSTPITELPSHWPDWYKDLVNERIRLIETDRDVGLIERPEHKRRWAREPWGKQQERALREWLQDRLEARELWFEGSGDQERAVCRSVAQLTDRVLATDPEFLDVARLWKGGVEIDPVQVVGELVADEHVPAQSGARYKGKGFDKRRQWERTWELQKMEDDGLPLSDGLERIPVPPKYTSAEFAKAPYWRHRGKLDVPKERFTSIWGAESAADGTMVLAWAGFDHVQLTQAIGALLVDRQSTDGWDADRSWPLVVAMAEQLFWLDLWHHEHDPRWGDSPANLFRSMVTEQAHRGGRTLADVADWRAPAPTRGRKKKDGA